MIPYWHKYAEEQGLTRYSASGQKQHLKPWINQLLFAGHPIILNTS